MYIYKLETLANKIEKAKLPPNGIKDNKLHLNQACTSTTNNYLRQNSAETFSINKSIELRIATPKDRTWAVKS